jgi:hypothetical protein
MKPQRVPNDRETVAARALAQMEKLRALYAHVEAEFTNVRLRTDMTADELDAAYLAYSGESRSWVESRRLQCDGCDGVPLALTLVGGEPDWEATTVLLCVTCLREALELAESPM